jgi:hypothetical protein
MVATINVIFLQHMKVRAFENLGAKRSLSENNDTRLSTPESLRGRR